ncbi:hypothetical protein SDC9_180245 [bioreactor metagenome]|uniref:Uncharacterized protein n=1 Tax=bioreactor metagenome TaxID=1076179 RepID=A0A645H152_9ZZZZ
MNETRGIKRAAGAAITQMQGTLHDRGAAIVGIRARENQRSSADLGQAATCATQHAGVDCVLAIVPTVRATATLELLSRL